MAGRDEICLICSWVCRQASPRPVRISAAALTATPATQPIVDDRFRFAVNEAALGPTVLLPISLTLEGTEVVFAYDLVDIATRPVGTFTRAEDTELPVAAPENWTLRNTSSHARFIG